MLGEPEGGWPKALPEDRPRVGARRSRSKGRPGATLPPADFAAAAEELADEDRARAARRGRAVVPAVPAGLPRLPRSTASSTATHRRSRRRPSSTACSRARRSSIEIERGKTLIVRYLTTGEVREDGTRTVFFELNGQPRDSPRRRPLGRGDCSSDTRRPTRTTPTTSPRRCRARCRPSRCSAGQDGQGRRAAAVDRGDEDGDGRLQSRATAAVERGARRPPAPSSKPAIFWSC